MPPALPEELAITTEFILPETLYLEVSSNVSSPKFGSLWASYIEIPCSEKFVTKVNFSLGSEIHLTFTESIS